ncbi:MAG TPA: hypothetical protein VGK33_06540 [Chloroflexota bacterium]
MAAASQFGITLEIDAMMVGNRLSQRDWTTYVAVDPDLVRLAGGAVTFARGELV